MPKRDNGEGLGDFEDEFEDPRSEDFPIADDEEDVITAGRDGREVATESERGVGFDGETSNSIGNDLVESASSGSDLSLLAVSFSVYEDVGVVEELRGENVLGPILPFGLAPRGK